MKSIRAAFFAFTAFALSAAPEARAEEKGNVSYSYYLVSCGNFVRHREDGSFSDIHNTADTFYVAGWISAYNRLKPENAIPDDITLDDIMLWLEHYCEENPLSNLEDGLFSLSVEAKAQTGFPQKSPQAQKPVSGAQHPAAQNLKPLPY